MKYQNLPQDLSIRYKVSVYNEIDKLFDLKDGELPSFHFMLALMGYKLDKKVDLHEITPGSDKPRDFSIRTVYPRNESELDSYYGLIAILDNLDLPYDHVIENIAFERTGLNGRPFLKMQNVRTFYEYMLGGLDFFQKNFMIDGDDPFRVASNIHNFLIKEDINLETILQELLEDEEIII